MTEARALAARCWDCGVGIGEPHLGLCDVARCLIDGYSQRLMCHHDDCGQDVHTGLWPGELECREFGWMLDMPVAGSEDLLAIPDLNRLTLAAARGELRWDRTAARFYPLDREAG